MTREEIEKYLRKYEIILTKGPRGAIGGPFRSGFARKQFMEHMTDKVHELFERVEFANKTALKIQENLITSYKKEIEQLKEQVKDKDQALQSLTPYDAEFHKPPGVPCVTCNATGRAGSSTSGICPSCNGSGIR